MEEVIIVTRDINGDRVPHYLIWDRVCEYINTHQEYLAEDVEILLILVEGSCIYSGIGSSPTITWEDIRGFFG